MKIQMEFTDEELEKLARACNQASIHSTNEDESEDYYRLQSSIEAILAFKLITPK